MEGLTLLEGYFSNLLAWVTVVTHLQLASFQEVIRCTLSEKTHTTVYLQKRMLNDSTHFGYVVPVSCVISDAAEVSSNLV